MKINSISQVVNLYSTQIRIARRLKESKNNVIHFDRVTISDEARRRLKIEGDKKRS